MKTIQYLQKTATFLAGIALMALVQNCNPGEPVINGDGATSWQLLAVAADSSQVQIIGMPNGTIAVEDAYKAANNGETLPGKIAFLTEFIDELYIAIPSANALYVLESTTLKRKAIISFTEQQLQPVKIVFANATTGYVLFNNSSKVSVIDRTVYKPTVFSLETNGIASDIEIAGNQGFISVRDRNRIVQFDTRNSSVRGEITVPTAPIFLKSDNEQENIVVVSAGAGKFDSQPATPARLSVINIASGALTEGAELFERANQRERALPRSIAITPRNLLYIALDSAVLRLDARLPDASRIAVRGQYTSVLYNLKRGELIYGTAKNSVSIANPSNGSVTSTVTLPENVAILLPR